MYTSYVHIDIYVHTHIYICIYTHKCIHHLYKRMYLYIHTTISTCIYIFQCIHHMYMYMYIHMCHLILAKRESAMHIHTDVMNTAIFLHPVSHGVSKKSCNTMQHNSIPISIPVAVCCRVLQCVATCCSVLHHVATTATHCNTIRSQSVSE